MCCIFYLKLPIRKFHHVHYLRHIHWMRYTQDSLGVYTIVTTNYNPTKTAVHYSAYPAYGT